jgi:nitrogen fixation/metabolism regulation signal transduction histidine kinase
MERSQFLNFKEGVMSFFESDTESAVEVKIKLAQAYISLKMMGVGNWTEDEIEGLLRDKILLIDSNVLFTYLTSQNNDSNHLLECFVDLKNRYNVKFYIAHETIEEFKHVIEHQITEIDTLTAKGVKILEFDNINSLDLDWFKVYREFCNTSHGDRFYEYVLDLLQKLQSDLQVDTLVLGI